MRRRLLVQAASLALGALAAAGAPAAERLELGRFGTGDTGGWTPKSFKGETRYTAREGGMCAESSGTASGLVREQRIDLVRTPLLGWSWKLERAVIPPPGDERSRAGDDYAARVYVVFSGGLMFWRTRGIAYVWSASQPVGTRWPNAFTANVRMIALQSGSARAGEWIAETRDVRADYRALFGADIERADAVAIMTDTDNGGGSAAACYGDVFFSGR